MDHNAVVLQEMTERYLLSELDPRVRDEFEEHFFNCPECALDLRAGAQFMAEAKTVLAERSEPASFRVVPARPRREWFGWLRPAFAVPVLAVLLIVISYQNLVTYPRLRSELGHPQILPAISVNVGTWGAGGLATEVADGNGLLLLVRIPPDSAYVRYTADFYTPEGKLAGSFAITPTSGQDQWPVTIPAVHREAGIYRLAISGITASGQSKNLGNASFELQIQR